MTAARPRVRWRHGPLAVPSADAAAALPSPAGASPMSSARPIVLALGLLSLGAASVAAQNRPMELQWLRNAGARIDGAVAAEHLGHCVGAAGDVNGDGMADYLVGATQDSGDQLHDPPGKAYLFLGHTGATPNGIGSALADV